MATVKTTSNEADAASAAPDRIAIERHRRGNRWMHWINFPLLTVMIWSGLRIYWADLRDPFVFGLGSWEIYDFFPDNVNETLGLERRLARGMAFHFTFAWLFVINGAAFGIYLWRTGGWRNFIPTKDDLRTIPAVMLHEAGIRKDPPPQGKYNGVQQLSYAAILAMGVLVILSGFAIYKPTQLSLLTTLFGGYSGARFVHFATTIGFLLFFVIHILQVARAGLSGFFSMVTGYELLPPDGPTPRHAFAETRFNARIRDLITVTLLPTVIVLGLAAIDSEPNPGWFRRIVLIAVVIGFLWDVLWVGLRGSTPGKQASGLQVVSAGTSDKPTIAQAALRALRWLPLMLLFIGNKPLVVTAIAVTLLLEIASTVLIIINPSRRSVMDLIARTEVVTIEEANHEVSPGAAPIGAEEVAR